VVIILVLLLAVSFSGYYYLELDKLPIKQKTSQVNKKNIWWEKLNDYAPGQNK
jgi:hypothetical protein